MNPVQQIIATKLKELAVELQQFEMTTHGSILSECKIERVCAALIAAHESPSAFCISELYQRIGRYLKAMERAESAEFHQRLPRHIILPPGAPAGTLEAARKLLEDAQ